MEIEKLTEEIFCLNYELNTLANLLLRRSSERWVPGFIHERTEHSHTERYNLACEFVKGKKVIDIACGIGKGSNIIATTGAAESVSGFDIQPDAIRYAKWRNGAINTTFEIGNAHSLGIINKFDIAVSFETVEHLTDYKKFIINIKDCLKPNGLFLISTPISALPLDTNPDNPYHVQEWGFYEFQHIIQEFFTIEKVYVQLYPAIINQPYIKPGLRQRIINKIKRTWPGKKPDVAENVVNAPVSIFSKIEEYNNQYPANELGTTRIGYQIILAKVKGI